MASSLGSPVRDGRTGLLRVRRDYPACNATRSSWTASTILCIRST